MHEKRTIPGKKAKIDTQKVAIRQENMTKGIYAHVADLPHQETKRAAMQFHPPIGEGYHSENELDYVKVGCYYLPYLTGQRNRTLITAKEVGSDVSAVSEETYFHHLGNTGGEIHLADMDKTIKI